MPVSETCILWVDVSRFRELMGYIRVVCQGSQYGPISSPITLALLCQSLSVSPNASPTLQKLDCEPMKVFSDLEHNIESGFYSLLYDPTIPFEGTLLKSTCQDKLALAAVKQSKTKPIETQTDYEQTAEPKRLGGSILPLPQDEMSQSLTAMMHLVSSIPPRYIQYNKVLSKQIEISLSQVESWKRKLEEMDTADKSKKLGKGISKETYQTFLQYKILHLLYDIWKKVWTRFSPAGRIWNVSKIYSIQSLQTAEHYLNCLGSWRRMLKLNTWEDVKKLAIMDDPGHTGHAQSAKDRLLMPSRLPDPENAGQIMLYSRNIPEMNESPDHETNVSKFRLLFVKSAAAQNAFTDRDLKQLLHGLLSDDGVLRISLVPHECQSQDFSYIEQSRIFIARAMEKEFRL